MWDRIETSFVFNEWKFVSTTLSITKDLIRQIWNIYLILFSNSSFFNLARLIFQKTLVYNIFKHFRKFNIYLNFDEMFDPFHKNIGHIILLSELVIRKYILLWNLNKENRQNKKLIDRIWLRIRISFKLFWRKKTMVLKYNSPIGNQKNK